MRGAGVTSDAASVGAIARPPFTSRPGKLTAGGSLGKTRTGNARAPHATLEQAPITNANILTWSRMVRA
jgi:hypothetical protein